MSWLAIFSVSFAVLFLLTNAEDPCRFETSKGVIDLTSVGLTDGKAAYPDEIPSIASNYKYSYNPCKPFTKGTICVDVAACQVSKDEQFAFILAKQDSAVWYSGSDADAPSISYSYNEKNVTVSLQCGNEGNDTFEVLGENPANNYTFRLTHKCACWDGCKTTTVTSTTTSLPTSTTTPSLTSTTTSSSISSTTTSQTTITTTSQTTACRFEHTKGVIDLTSLGRTDGNATYADITPPTSSNYKYSYNPCRPFSEGSICVDVAACQTSQDGSYSFILGKQDSAVWNAGSGLGSTPSVFYSYGDKKITVSLQCGRDTDNELEALGEEPTNNYKLRLTHKCACWNGCADGPPQTSTTTTPSTGGGDGINGRAVFIITLLVFPFVYFRGCVNY